MLWGFVAIFGCVVGVANGQEPVTVDLLIAGIYNPRFMVSLVYYRPAFELSVEDANRVQERRMSINLNYLDVQQNATCDDTVQDNEFLLARWYYEKRHPANKSVTAVILCGRCRRFSC